MKSGVGERRAPDIQGAWKAARRRSSREKRRATGATPRLHHHAHKHSTCRQTDKKTKKEALERERKSKVETANRRARARAK